MMMARVENPQALLDLAHDRTVVGRRALCDALLDVWLGDDVEDEPSAAMAEDILQTLLRQLEAEVRRELSERLSVEARAPHAVVTALANDVITVADPILRLSPVLDDKTLMDIIHRHGASHGQAIAARPVVSETLSDALAKLEDIDTTVTLLTNPGATVAIPTLSRLTKTARTAPELRAPLLSRPELNSALAAELYWWVSLELRKTIASRFTIDPAVLDRALQETVQKLIDTPTSAGHALADRLANENAITPQLLIQVLRGGQTDVFQILLARLTGLELGAVRCMVAQSGGETLALACRAMGIDKGYFATIFLLSRSARPGDKVVDPSELGRVMALYDRLIPSNVMDVLRQWRHDPSYLYAIAARSSHH